MLDFVNFGVLGARRMSSASRRTAFPIVRTPSIAEGLSPNS